MEHLAIMRRSWGLTDKILRGQKTVESRWYSTKRQPWNVIKTGETVYFKDSGGPVRARARVKKVIQFSDLTLSKVRAILNEHGRALGLEKGEIPEFCGRYQGKRYCLLIYLEDSVEIRPFEIDKTGFGMMAAWITVDDISKLKKRTGVIQSE